MSNLTFVNDALSLIGVLPSGQNATAEDSTLALRIVSDLADEWADDGIVISWDSQAEIGDDCPLIGTERAATQYALAVRLCPHFGREVPPTLAALTASAVGKLHRIQIVRSIEPAEPSMPIGQGDWWQGNYSIESDG